MKAGKIKSGMSHAYKRGNRKKAIGKLGRMMIGNAWMDLIDKKSTKKRKK